MVVGGGGAYVGTDCRHIRAKRPVRTCTSIIVSVETLSIQALMVLFAFNFGRIKSAFYISNETTCTLSEPNINTDAPK